MQCSSHFNYRRNVFLPHVPPCGKCLSCKINAQQEWAARLMLERKCYPNAVFYTLTFDDEHIVPDWKREHQLFIKRWRKKFGTQPRYFACGEYGALHGRQHFHGLFFGESAILQEGVAKRSFEKGKRIVFDPRFEETWQKGSTYVKDCNALTSGKNIAQYIAAYIVKPSSEQFSDKKEFAVMSRTPYIGQPAKKPLLDALTTKSGAIMCATLRTIPKKFRSGGMTYRIPKRIRTEIAYELGYPLRDIPRYDAIVDIDGQKVIREAWKPRKTRDEVLAAESRILGRIKAKSSRNTTPQTG